MSKWKWLFLQLNKKLWVRTTLFGLFALLTAFAALFFKDWVPEDFSREIGAKSVDNVLHIIANSMLAVTTFSLATMVAAYSTATSNAPPRATQLLLADNTSQNALSVFIGSFVFSLVSIIALSVGVYGDSGRLILFAVTVLVIVVVIGVMIRWINYLSRLGRVGHTICMVEKETAHAIRDRINHPFLGGRPLEKDKLPVTHYPLRCEKVGFVQHVDMDELQTLAEKHECEIYVPCTPGHFNDGIQPLAFVSTAVEEKTQKALVKAFTLGDDRSFEQDPRFGLVVLSEIASRALSPGINDGGTAMDIIASGLRVLLPWVQNCNGHVECRYPAVYVAPVKMGDLLDDLFTPIARDGAKLVEVGVCLQQAFSSLYAAGDTTTKKEVQRHARLALARAKAAMALPEDVEAVAAQGDFSG